MSSPVIRIAAEEWRSLARNRAGIIATLLLVALIIVSAVVSFERRAGIEAERTRYQASVDKGFDAQPARHPHRMVHYGQFVFRPLSPLAFVDFGIDSFTGNTIFLEGHRQNSANFSEARQSSLLLRFGQLTPAFVLQALAPLLLIFLAFTSVAREQACIRAADSAAPCRKLRTFATKRRQWAPRPAFTGPCASGATSLSRSMTEMGNIGGSYAGRRKPTFL